MFGGSDADYLADWEGMYDDLEVEYVYKPPTKAQLERSAKKRKAAKALRTEREGWNNPDLNNTMIRHLEKRAEAELEKNKARWRCLVTGCNPKLDSDTAPRHRVTTGHRVAAWPMRSIEGHRKQKQRQRNGYYDQYNVGYKSAGARGIEL